MGIPKDLAPSESPRLFLVDDNIRDIGGHYFELACLLAQGSIELGYTPCLATNRVFDQFEFVPDGIPCQAVIRPRRMVRWSLGVDGASNRCRDESGRVLNTGPLERWVTAISDRLIAPSKRPGTMLRRWAEDFARWMQQCHPTDRDSILINTADDFCLLALARSLRDVSHGDWNQRQPLTIDVVFHFAIQCANQTPSHMPPRDKLFARQVNDSIRACKPHRIRLHATTEALAQQMRDCGIESPVGVIPYPTRNRTAATPPQREALRIVLAGLPRAEKGRGAMREFLASIEDCHLKSGHYRVSMQMPASRSRWQPMVPESLHAAFENAMASPATSATESSVCDESKIDSSGPLDSLRPLEVMTENLDTEDYHAWLDSADVGLFLYDPVRYVARCSGVLLEMMARGVPVIVPDGCYLSDEVNAAGGDGSIGFIYHDRSQIATLLGKLYAEYAAIRERCRLHSKRIATKHSGANTLLTMGLSDLRDRRSAQVA